MTEPVASIVEFPKKPAKTVSSHEKIWDKPVLTHGYTALPSPRVLNVSFWR